MSHWNMLATDADLPLMAKTLSVSEITAQVMANRGIRSKKKALAYLNPSLSGLLEPYLMKDAEKAVTLMAEAAVRREKLMIYGDYDVDGVMGTVILYKILKRYGADVAYYIPHRAGEGYGLNKDAVRRIKDTGVSLIVTVDNGIAALEEVALANELGMRVVVIDHHEPGFVEANGVRADVTPPAEAVVDPKQAACPYPFKLLCAAGLSYKLAGAFCRHTGMPFSDQAELLALAAIATLCDIVELQDENRTIVRHGLAALNQNKRINPGLGSLIERRGYLDKPVDEFTAGFVLGPCINATGRLESAALSVQLMLSGAEDENDRRELAQKLTELNEERKKMTADSVNRVLETLSARPSLESVLVMADYETHESIAGIVAGRVKEVYHRPTIILTRGDNAMKGSGRSVEGYNLFEALYRHRHLFMRFGGHAMAAGLTLTEENIPILCERLNAECALTEDDFQATLAIDRVLQPDEITLALSEELARLAPFGRGNKEPLFAGYGFPVETFRSIEDKNTLLFTLAANGGRRLKGIGFGLNEAFAAALSDLFDDHERSLLAAGYMREAGLLLDAVFAVETNVYNGNASVQIRIKDFILRRK